MVAAVIWTAVIWSYVAEMQKHCYELLVLACRSKIHLLIITFKGKAMAEEDGLEHKYKRAYA